MFLYRSEATLFPDPLGPKYEGPAPSPLPEATRPEGNAFRLVSYNTHFGYEPEKLVATLRENQMTDADVVLLQEADDRCVRLIDEALRMGYVYYPAAVHPRSRSLFGVAVLSPWPITFSRKILLPAHSHFDSVRKIAMAAVVEIDAVRIAVVNIHLQAGLFRAAFRTHVEQLLACTIRGECLGDETPAPLPQTQGIVFAGDFNTWEKGLERIVVEEMSLASMKRVDGIEATFEGFSIGKTTMDYMFVSPDLYIGRGRVGATRLPSDHFPSEVELQLPRRPELSLAPRQSFREGAAFVER